MYIDIEYCSAEKFIFLLSSIYIVYEKKFGSNA